MLCFLDIDGVLNAEKPGKDWDDWEQWTYTDPQPLGSVKVYTINSSRAMLKALQALPLEIRWLTDWEHKAHHFAAAAGLEGTFPVETGVGTSNAHLPKIWWKRLVIERHLAESGKPFIWLDDNLRMFSLDWKKRDFTVGVARKARVPHLALSMNSPYGHYNPGRMGINRGLTKFDLALMERFCEGHKEKQDE